ncbi:SHOCT domain-containing protein [Mycobacterium sp. ITM-2016-00316]|uniref:SHOCT domain-containing protein n=1 Tax=Mycobacterium sp. ITM-2016-00316 TaxID=2099695 RepID=UPI000CFA7AC1|nr:SHOCT domain-containing protein [Mycobacterium sp. ITM-2016-00316]WNG83588.1 SHOCT domain-containing protein [Mycobacterium sp. ITM-2016-00316]
MSSPISPEADKALTDIAARHGLSRDAVLAMLSALHAGGGTMAQFDIPELGGSGQWMRGGMTMVSNMFDTALKARVDALCAELAQLLATTAVFPTRSAEPSGGWWPADLGVPSATGGQNDARYAIFPATRRLAIHLDGVTRVFDTADHRIAGVQQQQGGRRGSVTFTSQLGTFDVTSLTEIGAAPVAATPTVAPQQHAPAAGDASAIIGAIEALADLHERGIVSDGEFTAKKTELLGRL